jgi:uncharacterized protein YciI
MKYVLFYESAADVLEKAPLHAAAHNAYWIEFNRGGTLLMLGPFGNPQEGAMSVFTTREAAERFAAGDPFVQHRVVASWYVRDWNEVNAPP